MIGKNQNKQRRLFRRKGVNRSKVNDDFQSQVIGFFSGLSAHCYSSRPFSDKKQGSRTLRICTETLSLVSSGILPEWSLQSLRSRSVITLMNLQLLIVDRI